MREPETMCCSTGISSSVEEAVELALCRYARKVASDSQDYYFSASDLKISGFQEGWFRKTWVCELWYTRSPRKSVD